MTNIYKISIDEDGEGWADPVKPHSWLVDWCPTEGEALAFIYGKINFPSSWLLYRTLKVEAVTVYSNVN